MWFSRILGTGSYLPEKVLTNADLEKIVETSDNWIVERTGIKSRHIAGPKDTVATMGAQAAQKALEVAGLSPQDIEMIVVGTSTSDKVFPGSACYIQSLLGIKHCPAFDLQAACSGFIYGLQVIDNAIKSGSIKHALLIGSEVMSRIVDWTDRSTCVLFGDGAGAVVLGASEQPGVLSTKIDAKGEHTGLLELDNASTAIQQGTQARPYVHMEGNAVFRHAVKSLEQAAVEALADNQLTGEDIDWLVPHQANIRIIQATAKKLNLPMEKVILTVQEQGNTSAASLPLALDHGIRADKIQRGHKLLFEVFGAGLTWGSAVVQY